MLRGKNGAIPDPDEKEVTLPEDVDVDEEEKDQMDKEAMKAVAENQESPEEAFKRVSLKRINKVGKYLGLLENMAKQPNYSYSDKDVETMFGYIEEALRSCKRAYKGKENSKFSW